MRLQGNIYELSDGTYVGKIHNLLPTDGSSLDGHYTIVFKDSSDFNVYKHGDYGGFTTMIDVPFKGFLDLSPIDKAIMKDCVENTLSSLQKYPYKEGRKLMGTLIVFDWDYERSGVPTHLKESL